MGMEINSTLEQLVFNIEGPGIRDYAFVILIL
jgi:hypothetical protein